MRTFLWLIVIAALAAPAAYYFSREAEQTAPRTVAVPPAEPEPAIRYPIENAGPPPESPPTVPTENDARQALIELFGRRLERILVSDDIIRRVVATIDNLTRDHLPQRIMPVKSPGGLPFTKDTPEGLVLAPQKAARYGRYMRLIEAVPTNKLVAVYKRYYPLLQEEFERLGYPGRYFNDRVVAVFDHLLATPDVGGPLLLTERGVLYEFADPELERRSAGQKILLRIGTENRRKVKVKLQELRQALTTQLKTKDLAAP